MSSATTKDTSDHDLLVELRTTVNFIRNDIKVLSDGTHIRLNDHETRIKILETIAIQYDPKLLVPKFDQLLGEWVAFKTTGKTLEGVARIVWGVIGGSVALGLLEVIKRYATGDW